MARIAEALLGRLCRLAHVDVLITEGVHEMDLEFHEIVEALEIIAHQKSLEYGNKRFDVRSFDYDTKMCYSDIYRKFIRLEHQIWHDPPELYKSDHHTIDQLMESASDLAVYAIRMIQVLNRLEELYERQPTHPTPENDPDHGLHERPR